MTPVPVTLLTGFLGAGKTTLLNRLLADPATGRAAVIVNEIGALDIDGDLVVGATDALVTLRQGCLCCELRGDLLTTVRDLLARRARRFRPIQFDRLLIEGSGLASPGPVIQTFLLDPGLAAATRVTGVVGLAHAAHIAAQLAEHPEAADQLAYADRVLLNHADRVDAAERDAAKRAITALNPLAAVQETVRAETAAAAVLEERPAASAWRVQAGSLQPAAHSPGVVTWGREAEAPVDLHRLKLFLQLIAGKLDWKILRIKGIFACPGLDRAVVAHGVYQWLELGPGERPPPARSSLVVIGRGLDPGTLDRGWQAVQRR